MVNREPFGGLCAPSASGPRTHLAPAGYPLSRLLIWLSLGTVGRL